MFPDTTTNKMVVVLILTTMLRWMRIRLRNVVVMMTEVMIV